MENINCYKVMTIGENFIEGDEVVIFTKEELQRLINEYCGKGEELRYTLSFLTQEAKCKIITKTDVFEVMKNNN